MSRPVVPPPGRRGPTPPPPRRTPARLHGGGHDGRLIQPAPSGALPRFLDGDTGHSCHGDRGESLLRHPRLDVGVYVLTDVPTDAGAPVAPAYLHSSAMAEHRKVWELVAAALAGSHTGRVLTGGSNNPAAVLDALLDHVDDLIRARVQRGPAQRGQS